MLVASSSSSSSSSFFSFLFLFFFLVFLSPFFFFFFFFFYSRSDSEERLPMQLFSVLDAKRRRWYCSLSLSSLNEKDVPRSVSLTSEEDGVSVQCS